MYRISSNDQALGSEQALAGESSPYAETIRSASRFFGLLARAFWDNRASSQRVLGDGNCGDPDPGGETPCQKRKRMLMERAAALRRVRR